MVSGVAEKCQVYGILGQHRIGFAGDDGHDVVQALFVRLFFEIPEDIRSHVRKSADSGEIPKYAVPERVVFAETLARTSVGKIDKKKLRQQYAP